MICWKQKNSDFIVDDDDHYIEGDIVKTKETEKLIKDMEKKMKTAKSATERREAKHGGRWKNNIVPYQFASNFCNYSFLTLPRLGGKNDPCTTNLHIVNSANSLNFPKKFLSNLARLQLLLWRNHIWNLLDFVRMSDNEH